MLDHSIVEKKKPSVVNWSMLFATAGEGQIEIDKLRCKKYNSGSAFETAVQDSSFSCNRIF